MSDGLRELSTEQRQAMARAAMDRLWTNAALLETLDSAGNLIRSGAWRDTGRSFELVAQLDPCEDYWEAEVFGDVELRVAVDNRVGRVVLVRDDELTAEEAIEGGLAEVTSALYVREAEDEARLSACALVKRIGPELTRRAIALMDRFDHYSITIDASRVTATLADLYWDEEDWADAEFDVAAQIAAMSAIAAVMEAELPDAFTVCRYCSARFNAAAVDSCPQCGASM